MSLFKNNTLPEDITESCFECKRDGLTIRGTEYRPKGNALPAAIVCHGFMAFQDTVRHYAIELAKLGYCTYCFDFCGGSVIKGKSDGSTTEMSVLTQVRDLESVIAYVTQQTYNSGRLILMGCSQGGFVSALTAAENPEKVNGLILFYPALCIPDDARAGKMMFARFDPENIPDIINCGPMKLGRCYPSDVINMDPFKEISSYNGSVLIVHGSKDNIVAPHYSEKACQAYSNAELHIISGGAHGFSKAHDKKAMILMREFASKLI